MTEDDKRTKPLNLRVHRATHTYLSDLAKRGAHGTTATNVARNFIEIGIRDAIEKRYIRFRDLDFDDDVAQ